MLLQETKSTTNATFPIKYLDVAPGFDKWLKAAQNRIFSMAAGNRIAEIAPKIMEVGFAKILYAANELGADIEKSNPFVVFAPDGTCSYNPIRTQRGFSYGGILKFDFDGLMATNNSMPNGCGFTTFELVDPLPDDELNRYLADSQLRLGQDKLSQLGKGNHFAGIYYVLDPLSGEDTGMRQIVIHCSGHVGGHRLYHPESWLEKTDGFNVVHTPHGPITLLEGEAKKRYLMQYRETDDANTENRRLTMDEIFPDKQEWKTNDAITHQGLSKNGTTHWIGCQNYKGNVPVAFNPEEGLIIVKSKPNLSNGFIDNWIHGERVDQLGLRKEFNKLNLTPHGGGYEFKYPVKYTEIKLNSEGIESFFIKLNHKSGKMSFNYFREIREWMSYRRKTPIMQQLTRADLAEVVYELPALMQIYPLVSIPGGSH